MQSIEDGRFIVHLWQAPFRQDVTLTVSKLGYMTFEKKFKGPAYIKDLDVILEPVHGESAK